VRGEERREAERGARVAEEKEREWKREREGLECAICELRKQVERERERGRDGDRLRCEVEVMKREALERGERERRERREREEVEKECSDLRERLGLALEEVSTLWEVRKLMQARLSDYDKLQARREGNVASRIAVPKAGQSGGWGGTRVVGRGGEAGGEFHHEYSRGEEEDDGIIMEFGPPSP
jgi:hypothetical protein